MSQRSAWANVQGRDETTFSRPIGSVGAVSGIFVRICESAVSVKKKWVNSTPSIKIFTGLMLLVNLLYIGVAIVYGPTKIFDEAAKYAVELKEQTWGPFVLILGLVLASIPPMFGYAMMVMICGFGFGFARGWIIATVGAMLGAFISFVICRYVVRKWQNEAGNWLHQDKRFSGLSEAIRTKGLKLIFLVRLAPFPYNMSNLMFASIPTVTLGQFMLANSVIMPKLLLHVWIGSRLFLLADEDSRAHLDTSTRILNIAYIVIGTAAGIWAGFYVYQLTQEQIKQANLTSRQRYHEEEEGLLNGASGDMS